MNLKTRTWIAALRLRTLPLSVAGAVFAAGIALRAGEFRLGVFLPTLTTTLLLQILSNLANDYGDGVRGTDNQERKGPLRAVQSGVISPGEMLTGILVTAALCCLSGLGLLYASFGTRHMAVAAAFIALGALCILAAVKYTVGKNPYGYAGLGDVGVFVFFGIVSVSGSYFLYGLCFYPSVLLPSAAIGLLSIGVLNMNNLRDYHNDRASGKMTIAVRLGMKRGKIYQGVCIVGAMILLLVFSAISGGGIADYAYVLIFPVLCIHLLRISRVRHHRDFDRELKVVSLSTLLISIFYAVTGL